MRQAFAGCANHCGDLWDCGDRLWAGLAAGLGNCGHWPRSATSLCLDRSNGRTTTQV